MSLRHQSRAPPKKTKSLTPAPYPYPPDQSGALPEAEWSYVLFGWDNLFAALLLGASNRDAAYSALIQAVRAKAAAGFVSNFEAGGAKSQDRTEPMVGARVLAELYKKYGDAWLVELLLDDLHGQLQLPYRQQRLLVAVGSRHVEIVVRQGAE